MEIKPRYIGAGVVMLVATVAAVWLALGTVSIEGVKVPKDLGKLTETAHQQGDAYKPEATSFSGTCLSNDQIDDAKRADIKLVTGKDPEQCMADVDARDRPLDLFLGVIALIVVSAVLYGAFWLGNISRDANLLVIVLGGFGCILLGALLDDYVKDWLTNRNVVMELFWRGAGATVFVVAGFAIMHAILDKED